MNNGGALTKSGGLMIAMSAKAYSVPFIIISAMYKLTPKFPFEQMSFNEIVNPGNVYSRKDKYIEENVNIIIKKYNYISPEYVSIYLTNFGEFTAAHIYRLFSEYYGEEIDMKTLKKVISEFKLKKKTLK